MTVFLARASPPTLYYYVYHVYVSSKKRFYFNRGAK